MDTPSSSGVESVASRDPASPALASHSRFVQRVRRRYESELPLLPAGVPTRASIDALSGPTRLASQCSTHASVEFCE